MPLEPCRDISKVMAFADALSIGCKVRMCHAERVASGSRFLGARSGVDVEVGYDWLRIDYSDGVEVHSNRSQG